MMAMAPSPRLPKFILLSLSIITSTTCSPSTPLTSALVGLGASPSLIASLTAHVVDQQWPLSGALARVAQVQFGVDNGILSGTEAHQIICQRDFLQCECVACMPHPGRTTC